MHIEHGPSLKSVGIHWVQCWEYVLDLPSSGTWCQQTVWYYSRWNTGVKVKVAQSCPTLCNPVGGLYSPWNSPGQNTGWGSCFLLQGILPVQGSNPGLLHYRQILYQLSHKGSPRMLEWVAHPFSSRFFWPRNWTGVSCIAGRFFTNWAIREAHMEHMRPEYWQTGFGSKGLLALFFSFSPIIMYTVLLKSDPLN